MNEIRIGLDRPLMRQASAALRKGYDSALLGYGLVFAIQLKMIWQIGQYRDMTGGDTGAYFGRAFAWATRLQTDVTRSPLYTSFFGTIYALTQDAYDATILHRAIIALLAAIGVLAVARRLLPPALALLVGVWWAVLPINFDVFYEVHLFALLPILAMWLIASRADSSASRGAAFAILVLTTLLLRYEFSLSCLLYGLYCLWRERGTGWRSIGLSYGLPLVATGLLSLFFYWRTPASFEQLAASLDYKHASNMCQVYAFGFQQRHPDWTASPWTDCQGLMARIFGSDHASLRQMATNNPSALLDHFLWNLSLTPSGLEIALFNAASGSVNPDFTPTHLGAAYPFWLAVLGVVICIAGAARALIAWRTVWSVRFRPLAYRLVPLAAVVMTAPPVILTQRPRPEYIYPLTFLLMIAIGAALHVLTYRRARAVGICSLMIAAAVLLFVPPYYPAHATGRPAKMAYDRLHPYGTLLDALPGAVVLGDDSGVMANWLGLARSRASVLGYGAVPGWGPSIDLCSKADCRALSAIFIAPRLRGTAPLQCPQDPDGQPWLAVGTAAENENGLLMIRRTDDLQLDSTVAAVPCAALPRAVPADTAVTP